MSGFWYSDASKSRLRTGQVAGLFSERFLMTCRHVFRLILIVLFLREHAGTLYFTTHYACRHFAADTHVNSFLVFFLYIFWKDFLVVLRCQNWKKHWNSSSVVKFACRCHFGALQTDFLSLRSVFWIPFVAPGAPQGLPWGPQAAPKTVQIGVQEASSKKKVGSFLWSGTPKPFQDPSGGDFSWFLMIF